MIDVRYLPVVNPWSGRTIHTVRGAAVDHVRYLIEEYRRWPAPPATHEEMIRKIKFHQAAVGCLAYAVSIAGFFGSLRGWRHFGPDWVVVRKLGGWEVNERFPLREIYWEAIADGKQMELFDIAHIEETDG